MPKRDEEYLGDGVYATHDGYHVWLRCDGWDGREQRIALDPIVFRRLTEYAQRLSAPTPDGAA